MYSLLILIVLSLNFANTSDCNKENQSGGSMDIYKSPAEYLLSYGYNFEEHKVMTSDGYILTLWRIPKKVNEKRTRRPPILLQHGVIDNSFSWIFNKIKHNLATMLVDRGYDVWLGNNRGSLNSKEHIDPYNYNWKNIRSQFWDFSFDHMGVSDFPAMIDYICDCTQFEKMFYVGHSQGSTQFLIKAMLNPDYVNNHIAGFVAMAPALYLGNIAGMVTDVAKKYKLVDMIYYSGFKNFGLYPFMSTVYVYITQLLPKLATTIIYTITGSVEKEKMDYERLPVVATNELGGTSIQNMMHWVQLMRNKGDEFKMFDYGKDENIKHYNKSEPPIYKVQNLKNLRMPIYMVAGKSDSIITKKDFKRVLNLLPTNTTYHEYIEDYAHLDYIWAEDAYKKLYPKVINFLNKIRLNTPVR